MRRFLAVLLTIVTIFAIRESIYIFNSNDQDIVAKKAQLSIAAVTITLPLILFTFWLWLGKRAEQE